MKTATQPGQTPMPPCSICGKAKFADQALAIAANGRLVHKECKP